MSIGVTQDPFIVSIQASYRSSVNKNKQMGNGNQIFGTNL